jgi:lysophospholipase L1-like esterase
LVVPKTAAQGRPWIWRTEFFGHEPQTTVIAKPGVGHHPHSLANPFPIVAFVLEHTGVNLPPADLLKESRRIVFLGDSITAAGVYVADVDAWLVAKKSGVPHHVICAGLPSETVSGLSEEGHAGGQFPRPDLAERLERVLALTKPDLVIACYGINCAIYEPFDKGRFERYQQGIKHLKLAVEEHAARLVLITPPFYDDQRAPKSFLYNGVLDRYSDWLLEQRKEGWHVVDLHGAMTQEVAKRRRTDPKFTFQPDGVHPNEAGQWYVASQLIRWFGDEKSAAADSAQDMLKSLGAPPELLPLVQQRINLLRDSYVGAAGHKRPGIKPGLPVTEAEKQAAELTARIQKLMATEK